MNERTGPVTPAGDVSRVAATVDGRGRGGKTTNLTTVLRIMGFEGVGRNLNFEIVIAPAVVIMVSIVIVTMFTTLAAVLALDRLRIRGEGFLWAGPDALDVGPHTNLTTKVVEKRTTQTHPDLHHCGLTNVDDPRLFAILGEHTVHLDFQLGDKGIDVTLVVSMRLTKRYTFRTST
ncbi:MAG: hypothetical protein ACOC9C_03260 [Chloroflexota bacterium]